MMDLDPDLGGPWSRSGWSMVQLRVVHDPDPGGKGTLEELDRALGPDPRSKILIRGP